MRIEGPSGARPPAGAGKAGRQRGSARTRRAADAVRVADAASLREKAAAMLQAMPEARLERIEAIRSAIERGDYQVPTREVARKIVLNALAEAPW